MVSHCGASAVCIRSWFACGVAGPVDLGGRADRWGRRIGPVLACWNRGASMGASGERLNGAVVAAGCWSRAVAQARSACGLGLPVVAPGRWIWAVGRIDAGVAAARWWCAGSGFQVQKSWSKFGRGTRELAARADRFGRGNGQVVACWWSCSHCGASAVCLRPGLPVVAPGRWPWGRGRIDAGVAAARWWPARTAARARFAFGPGLPAVSPVRWTWAGGRIDAGVAAARWWCAGSGFQVQKSWSKFGRGSVALEERADRCGRSNGSLLARWHRGA